MENRKSFCTEDKMETGHCSVCGEVIPVEFLSMLPETEKYYREASVRISKGEEVHPPKGIDSSILLCPKCLAKWEQEHRGN